MKFKFLYILFLVLLASCTEEEKPNISEDPDLSLDKITVTRSIRAMAPGSESLAPGEAVALVGNNEFTANSILYVSQLGNTTDPNFSSSATNNLYQFKYEANPDADWDTGTNFVLTGTNALTWTDIQRLGSVGNAFSLFAMSFPGNSISFSVAKDQTGGIGNPYSETNFLNSDILGAYHATSALYTRLRFNLFHLMTYLKVTIYVPDYVEEFNDAGQPSYSGFKAGALEEGYVLNTYQNFMIDWRANRSSDSEAPLTYGTGNSTSIKMYMHPPVSDVIDLENVKEYFAASSLEEDKVRAYNFSVLFPARNSTDNTNISLCFFLRNQDNQMKYYYFESPQITQGTYTPAQGTLQQLYLYLPRTNNQAILVGAKILGWGTASTDMTVVQQPSGYTEEDDFE